MRFSKRIENLSFSLKKISTVFFKLLGSGLDFDLKKATNTTAKFVGISSLEEWSLQALPGLAGLDPKLGYEGKKFVKFQKLDFSIELQSLFWFY